MESTNLNMFPRPRGLALFKILIASLTLIILLTQIGKKTTHKSTKAKPINIQGILRTKNGNIVDEQGKNVSICWNVTRNGKFIQQNDTQFAPRLVSRISNATKPWLYLYSGYYDDRETVKNGSVVRVTGMIQRNRIKDIKDKYYCYLWYPSSSYPVTVKAKGRILWTYDAPFMSAIFTCPVPSSHKNLPTDVTISDEKCQNITNMISIRPELISKKTGNVGICCKVIYGSPDPVRIVEWVELNLLIGAEHIYMYNSSLKGKVNTVLDYYQELGVMTVYKHDFPNKMNKEALRKPFPFQGFLANYNGYNQNWELEVMSLTDCPYVAKERFLVTVDIDEILWPNKHGNYKDLTEHLHNQTKPRGAASYTFWTGNFVDEFKADTKPFYPKYLHMLRYNKRTKIDWESPKSIIDSKYAVGTGHHVALMKTQDAIQKFEISDGKVGYNRHYREHCRLVGAPNKCKNLMANPQNDTTLDKFKDKLVERVFPVLKQFHLL
ncbi:unnamed protein product [Owenia fusiformis]|uniref:Glycosyltransferase family 92 protein n=1 Tax=Owenia fusiformis TaxID=6347 RepID=A0A8J1TVF8_OWEFU|nr:unnamed protein product [Owenia fusiformis]